MSVLYITEMQSTDVPNVGRKTSGLNASSKDSLAPRIVGADRLNDAIVVEFEDGVCATFPADLLRSLILQLDAPAVLTER